MKMFFYFLKQLEQDRFTTCFKTCGTGSLFWRVGRVCKVSLVPSFANKTGGRENFTDRQTHIQTEKKEKNLKVFKFGRKKIFLPVNNSLTRTIRRGV